MSKFKKWTDERAKQLPERLRLLTKPILDPGDIVFIHDPTWKRTGAVMQPCCNNKIPILVEGRGWVCDTCGAHLSGN